MSSTLSTPRSFGALVLGLALIGCNKGQDGLPAPEVSEEVGLRRLTGCDDLRAHVSDVMLEQIVKSYGGYRGYPVSPGVESDAAEDANSGEGPADYTGTNNQEAGVDELDNVKTNGTHLFVAQNKAFHILKSWPAAETEQVAKIELPGWTYGMFLVDDHTAVVLSSLSPQEAGLPADAWWSATRAHVIDITDPAAPVVTRTEDAEGWLTSARMIQGQITLVLNQYVQFDWAVWEAVYAEAATHAQPAWDAPAEDWTAYESEMRAALAPLVDAAVAGMSLDDLLPDARTGEADYHAMYACEDLFVPAQYTNLGMLSVARIDPATPGLRATGIMSEGWLSYASPTHLYVAQTSWSWWGWTPDATRTHIHRFEIDGDAPAYLGSGAVDGWLLNQFSMSEHDGYLRVATSDSWGWFGGGVAVDAGGTAEASGDGTSSGSGEASSGSEGEATDPPAMTAEDADPVEEPPVPANNVFVMGTTPDGGLEVIGEVRGIGENETIQAVRFLGDKGYVVTFRRTDPLFTLDLSVPTAPTLVGELVMPGYSAYLHPIDEGHLLGVGMAGTESGQLTGLSVAVFDVTDLANPTLMHRYDIDPGDNAWSWSDALWDHHAFTYHNGVLTLPAFTSSYDPITGATTGFSGVISLEAGVDGISEVGRVDHQPLIEGSACIYDIWWQVDGMAEGDAVGDGEPGVEDPSDPTDPTGVGDWSYCDTGYWYSSVRRAVYIEDYLYSVSDYGVRVTDLYDPTSGIADVRFYPLP